MDYVELDPRLIISFSGQCLISAVDETAWYPGEVYEDGTVVCWGAYGDDLGEAIGSLFGSQTTRSER